MVIYLDVLLAVNWVIDFLLLHAVARVTRRAYRPWRLVAGAAIGAAGCAVIFLPELSVWMSILCKGATAFFMIIAAFGFRKCGISAVLLFLFSTATAGLAMLLWWTLAPGGLQVINGIVYYDIPPLVLIATTGAAYGLMCVYARLVRRREPRGKEYYLLIEQDGKQAQIAARYDSGNDLSEPFSGAPVAVATYESVAPLLSPAWRQSELPRGARAIPYATVGGKGLLPAFRPEKLTLINGAERTDVTGAFIAVTDHAFDGGYAALIGTAMIYSER